MVLALTYVAVNIRSTVVKIVSEATRRLVQHDPQEHRRLCPEEACIANPERLSIRQSLLSENDSLPPEP